MCYYRMEIKYVFSQADTIDLGIWKILLLLNQFSPLI